MRMLAWLWGRLMPRFWRHAATAFTVTKKALNKAG